MRTEPGDGDPIRTQIVERMTGETGDPHQVLDAARASAMRALPALLEALGERFATPPTVDVAEVDVVRLAELKPEQDDLGSLVVVPASTSRDALTMKLDPRALSLLVGMLFGGDPDIPPPPLDRVPSRIELDVATMVFEIFAEALNGTGPRALGLRLPVSRPLAGPGDFKRFIVRDAPGVRIDFSIGAGEEAGLLTAWMPQRVMLELRAPVSGGAGEQVKKADWRQRFSEEIMRSSVDLTATVPLTKMSLRSLAGLKVGQVLELGPRAQAETRLSVRNRTVFVCEFGKLGQNYTVRVKQPFDARQDVLDGLMAR